MTGRAGSSRGMLGWAVASGVLLGAAYTLSPLTVLVLAGLPIGWRWVSRDLSERERHWLGLVLFVAVAVRLAAIAGLFLSASHAVPYANFFGDEEFFKRRSVWMRNIGLGVPISTADFIYAYDDVGRTSYLYIIAYLQAIVGNAPYGLQMLNVAVYVTGMLALYRLVRPVYGGLAALGGLVLLLFLPSMFAWSISALREAPYMCAGALEVVAAVCVFRTHGWRRAAAIVALAGCGVIQQGLRDGGIAMLIGGGVGGLVLATLIPRPRLLFASVIAAVLVAAAVANRPAVQQRASALVYTVTYKHWGQVVTPGYTYKLLDPDIYPDRSRLLRLTRPEVERYVLRASAAYLIVPAPWQIESRAALAYLPEQVLWYVLAALAPIGLWVGFRRDVLVTSVVACHAATASLMVALTGGNIGTLVRHRGLALPYLVWLSALGAVEVARWLLARRAHTSPMLTPLEIW
jgi:hypothetical protein